MSNKEKLESFIVGFRLGAMPKTKKFMMPGKHHLKGKSWFDNYNEDLLSQIRDHRYRNS